MIAADRTKWAASWGGLRDAGNPAQTPAAAREHGVNRFADRRRDRHAAALAALPGQLQHAVPGVIAKIVNAASISDPTRSPAIKESPNERGYTDRVGVGRRDHPVRLSAGRAR